MTHWLLSIIRHPHGFVLPPWCISPTSPPRRLRRVEPKWAFVKTEAADSDTASRIFLKALHAARNTRRDLRML